MIKMKRFEILSDNRWVCELTGRRCNTEWDCMDCWGQYNGDEEKLKELSIKKVGLVKDGGEKGKCIYVSGNNYLSEERKYCPYIDKVGGCETCDYPELAVVREMKSRTMADSGRICQFHKDVCIRAPLPSICEFCQRNPNLQTITVR